MGDDLSEFERRRLDNIQRNEAFLKSLGLSAVKVSLDHTSKIEEKKDVRVKRERDSKHLRVEQPTRYSKRLRSQNDATVVEVENIDAEEEQEDSGLVEYSEFPEVL